MNIQFFGGAQEVTGSQYLLTINSKKILLECGLFQGRREESYERNLDFKFDPASVDMMVLSHAHMDHSGNIPNLVKHGFQGPIYMTPPTAELCKIMLKDSAFLQERDVYWVNKIRAKKHIQPLLPLYSLGDAETAMESFAPIEYDTMTEIAPGVVLSFKDAGHILGSASILLEITEKGRHLDFGFTGDLGRPGIPILRDPNIVRDLDVLLTESTYGDRLHDSFDDVEGELSEIIRTQCQTGGKIIIPSFAVGRTQLIVFLLHKLFNQNRIPEIPIFVDSPMASHATEVFRNYPQYFDRETARLFLESQEDPFGFRRLTYVEQVDESKKLNGISYPHIIISASGMAEGGRILHHLKHNIGDPKAMVLFVGYAARHTLARKILDGEPVVKIFGEEHKVRCKIRKMDAFSAHADRRGLLEFIKMSKPEKLKNIFMVHGEPDQAETLINAIRSMGYPSVEYPAPGASVTI